MRLHSLLFWFVIYFVLISCLIFVLFLNLSIIKNVPNFVVHIFNTITICISIYVCSISFLYKKIYATRNNELVMHHLILNKSKTINLEQVISIKSVFPVIVDPFTFRITYIEGENTQNVYFAKSLSLIFEDDLIKMLKNKLNNSPFGSRMR